MENYELLDTVGAGGFGVTRKVRKRGTEEILAMKCLPRGHLDEEYVKREILNHSRLQHPNVIQFKEVVLNDKILGIVMEFADAGDLLREILVFGGAFSEAKAKRIFQQLIAGVSYIHFKRVSHRDLKPGNILLTSNQVLKICDFGLSKSSTIHSEATTEVGTEKYKAPEVHYGLPYDGKRADVWSCGVILYAMLTRKFPNPTSAAQSINQLPSTVSEDCKNLLRGMLVVDPRQRFSIEDIKDHTWYLTDLPPHLTREEQAAFYNNDNVILSDQIQSEDDIIQIIEEAKMTPQMLGTVEEGVETSNTVERENETEDTKDLKDVEETKLPTPLN